MSKDELGEKKQWMSELRLAAAKQNEISNLVIASPATDFLLNHTKERPKDQWQENQKCDSEENKQELALNYKEDGNFYMKQKMFHSAVESFTNGIEVKCKNPEVQAVLYNNRSAAHYYLMNYCLALSDAQQALVYKPDYAKTRWRAARCAAQLNKFELCTQLCEEILKQDASHKEAQDLLKHNKAKKLEVQRNAIREAAGAKKQFQSLCNLLKLRGIKFYGLKENEPITADLLRPKFPGLECIPVHLANDGSFAWPSAFFYPQIPRTDFIQQLCEHLTMENVLVQLFSKFPQSEKVREYRPDNVTVYYENTDAVDLNKVDLNKNIKDIISEKGFVVIGGCLVFYVLLTGSQQEKDFINLRRMGPKFKKR